MVEITNDNSTIPQIQEILKNEGITFKTLSFEEIENLLSSTGLPSIEDTTKLSINSKNYIYFVTNDEVLASLWFNPTTGYKLDLIMRNVEKENPSPEETKILEDLYDLRNCKGFSLTEDLVTFLEKLFENKNTEVEEKTEEPPPIPGKIQRTVDKIKRLLGI